MFSAFAASFNLSAAFLAKLDALESFDSCSDKSDMDLDDVERPADATLTKFDCVVLGFFVFRAVIVISNAFFSANILLYAWVISLGF